MPTRKHHLLGTNLKRWLVHEAFEDARAVKVWTMRAPDE